MGDPEFLAMATLYCSFPMEMSCFLNFRKNIIRSLESEMRNAKIPGPLCPPPQESGNYAIQGC